MEYLTGASTDGRVTVTACYEYAHCSGRWDTKHCAIMGPSLNDARDLCGTAGIGPSIYVVGGHNDLNLVASME